MNREVAHDQVLRDVFRLLRRQKWVIIGTVLLAVAAAVAYSLLKTKEYEAKAQIQFVDQSQYLSTIGTTGPFTGQTPAQIAAQGAERVTSPEVVSAVAGDVDTDLSNEEIKDSVETSVNPDSSLVSLTVTADSAKLSADLANAFANETKNVLTERQRALFLSQAQTLAQSVKGLGDASIERQITLQNAARLRSVASVATPVEIANPATEPDHPSSPRPVRDGILAVILGLVFGIVFAFLRDSLDRRLTDPRDIQHELQIPMLGYVDAASLGDAAFTGNGRKPGHSLEPFRILRTNVEVLAGEKQLQTIAVTSPLAEEGKSTVAAGLATAAALVDRRVLLVECDLRRPVFADRLGVPASPGITDWAAGNAQPAEVLRSVPIVASDGAEPQNGGESNRHHSLTVITAGSQIAEPAELLASRRFREFVTEVRDSYDLIVLDCAPLLSVGDALEVLRLVDATLLCIRLDQTTREQALAAKTAIGHMPHRPVGMVLTGVRPGREGYYYGYYSSTASRPAILVQPPRSS
ncbi:MAG TPA: Wzz/FepE/Etk N-terminal domain-containing protein [Solirubrobacterales bacterium]|jgi:capsular exopolysaccharide synthesis family protein